MAWDQRQTAMLRAMGLRVWAPTPKAPEDADVDVATMAAPAVPSPAPSPAPVHIAAALPQRRPAPAVEPAPRDDAIATLDWDALLQAMAACTLGDGSGRAVPGSGKRQADLMIIGELPGEAEEQQGEPFAGPAGKLLDNMLRALGLARGEVFLTHAIPCRPPRGRSPGPDDLARCEPLLLRQIALVQPRVILALGRAGQWLLRSREPLGRLRGQLHAYADTPLAVSYHPAYLLRTPADKARAWEDLCLAREALAR